MRSLITLSICLASAFSLTCFESDNQGTVTEISNPAWTHCVMVPAKGRGRARHFGVGPEEDSTENYEKTLLTSTDSSYSILSVCIYERYDLGALSGSKPMPEFLFRCMCNYDLCNSGNTVEAFLSEMKKINS